MTLAMRDGTIRGMFMHGPEPGGRRQQLRMVVQRGLAELEWMVVRDMRRDRDRRLLVRGA